MNSPFKFLDSYTLEDRAIFFGREQEIEEMYRKVFEGKILLVYGISGTGKTSIINCGLANKFEESDWLPVQVRRGKNLVESLVNELGKAALTPLLTSPLKGGEMVQIIRSVYLDHFKPVYLIFDQFEELFVFGDREERKQFIQIVKETITSDVPCKLIFSIREEYLAGVTEFEEMIPDFMSNRMRVEKMTRQHAVQVIEGPCKVHGIEVEKGFAETMLERLTPGMNEVELTYLQVYLDRIFKLAGKEQKPEDKNIRFSLQLLDKVGNVSDLLSQFLEEQINNLPDPETGLVILKSFVSIKGTKRQLTSEEVAESVRLLGRGIAPDTVAEYLNTFVNLRILREKDENHRYELRHDSLASKIFEKITLVEKELLEVRNYIENEFENYKKRGVILSDRDLEYISRYEKSLFLNAELTDFIRKSKEKANARARVFRIITTLASVFFVVVLCGVLFYSLRSNSKIRSKNKALQSLLMKNDDPVAAWKLAAEAYHIKKTPTTTRAVFEAFYSLLNGNEYYDSLGNRVYPLKKIFDFTECKATILSARFSEDGKYLYGFLTDSTIMVWDITGSVIRSFTGLHAPVLTVKLSADNNFVGGLDKDSCLHVWDMEGRKILQIKAWYNRINPGHVFNFSPDGKFLACAVPGNQASIYKTSGELLQTLAGHRAPVTSVTFSPDSRFLATTSMDSTILVWYYNKKRTEYNEYTRLTGHRNIVWSAQFSKRSNYILTASADTSCKIWDLNGKIIYNGDFTSLYLPAALRVKFCDATFVGDDRAMVFTYYKSTIYRDSSLSHASVSEPGLLFGQEGRISEWTTYYPGASELFYDYLRTLAISDSTNKIRFTGIDFNKSVEYAAYSFSDHHDVFYLAGTRDAYKLFTFKGKMQQFSPDGRYLLAIFNKYLILYPADEQEILRLMNEQKIFGELKSSKVNFDKWYLLK